MKNLILLILLMGSFSSFASDCSVQVIGHYAGIYHRTYKAANNTFLNNFVGRKNMMAHTFGVPKVAFLGLAISGENYIAEDIVSKSGRSGQEVYERYMALLESGELCHDLGEDYQKPRQVKRYLLHKLL